MAIANGQAAIRPHASRAQANRPRQDPRQSPMRAPQRSLIQTGYDRLFLPVTVNSFWPMKAALRKVRMAVWPWRSSLLEINTERGFPRSEKAMPADKCGQGVRREIDCDCFRFNIIAGASRYLGISLGRTGQKL